MLRIKTWTPPKGGEKLFVGKKKKDDSHVLKEGKTYESGGFN